MARKRARSLDSGVRLPPTVADLADRLAATAQQLEADESSRHALTMSLFEQVRELAENHSTTKRIKLDPTLARHSATTANNATFTTSAILPTARHRADGSHDNSTVVVSLKDGRLTDGVALRSTICEILAHVLNCMLREVTSGDKGRSTWKHAITKIGMDLVRGRKSEQ